MGIYLDGAGDYVDLANPPVMNNVDDLCLEGWFWADYPVIENVSRHIFMYNGNGASNGYGFEIGGQAGWRGKLGLLLGGVVHFNFETQIEHYLWHHYAISRRSGTWYSFEDGVESGVTTVTAPNIPTNYSTIGYDHGNQCFTGYVCECRYWSIPRTESEIRTNMHRRVGAQPGLEAVIRFLEQSGGSAADYSDKANHGTLVGNPTWEEGYPIPHGRPYILP